jgi:cytochrome c-type biogenesis protein CcmE
MEKKAIRISERQIKITAVIIIVVVVVAVLLWGMVPNRIYDTSEIIENSQSFNGRLVNVSGVVEGWMLSLNNFTLVDSLNDSFKINITHNGGFPGGFGNNETVVVTGIFFSGINHIESQSIQIGCPSKY